MMESTTTTVLNTQLKCVLCSDGTQHSPDIKRIKNEVYTCIMFAILHVCYLLLFVYMLMGQTAYCMNKVLYCTLNGIGAAFEIESRTMIF